MSGLKNTFRKAAALTAIISAATGLFGAAIAWFNKKNTSNKMLFLLLTVCSLLLCEMSIAPLSGSSRNHVNTVSEHNFPAETEIFCISSTSSALPVQVEKVRIGSIHLSARQLNRLLSETVFGRPADFCMARTATISIFRSLYLRLSLPPSDISFPFSAFW